MLRFSCAIPLKYKSIEYRALRPLLLAYDEANYYGAHGNVESLAGKYSHEDKRVRLKYQADENDIHQLACHSILMGFRLLEVAHEVLMPHIQHKESVEESVKSAAQAVRFALLDEATRQFGGSIPLQAFKAVYDGNWDAIDKMFEDLVEREESRSKDRAKAKSEGAT